MKSISLKMLIFDFWLLLNFQSQELPLVLWIFISLIIWNFFNWISNYKNNSKFNQLPHHRFEIWKSHWYMWTYQELFNCVLFQLYQALNWVYWIFCKVINLCYLSKWMVIEGGIFYTLVLSIHALKSHQFFCGDNPNNYNIKGNVDLKMLIHDTLFLLISQLEKKL